MKERLKSVKREPSFAWVNGRKEPAAPDVTYTNAAWEQSILLVSQGNPFKQLGKSRGRIGGDFEVYHRQLVEDTPSPYFYTHNGPVTGGYADYRYRGKLYAGNRKNNEGYSGTLGYTQITGYPTWEGSSRTSLIPKGTTAISIVEPTNPLAGLTVALAELRREGLPSLPGIQALKGRTALAKSAGSEYLNKEFGWDPLISDVRKILWVRNNEEKLIEQYSRGSGRKIHRRFTFPTERSTTTTSGTGDSRMYPVLNPTCYVAPPKWSETETITKKVWFEGCFTYYLPPAKAGGGNFQRERQLAEKLYGVGITPETVWNLVPWSWAVDWFTNAGDVIHNIGAFANNGLVMQYGYIMEETVHDLQTRVWDIRTKASEHLVNPITGEMPQRMSCSSTARSITRKRYAATPYGFGLDFDGFSPFQLSILSALGLSRH